MNSGFDYEQARRFIKRHCVQEKAPFTGQPLDLLPYQETILQSLCAGNHDLVSCWIPRKNGKSSFAAAVALLYLILVPGSEVYIIAPLLTQAQHLFRTIVDFISNSPKLRNSLWVREHVRTIQYKRSVIQVLSADKRRSSYNANLVILDELAEIPQPVAPELYDKVSYSILARRPNAAVLTLSTAQYDRGFGYDFFSRMKKCHDDHCEPTTLPILFSLDVDQDYSTEESWRKVNPGADKLWTIADMQTDYERTKDNPRELAKFRTFRLCSWVGSADHWIPPLTWQLCHDANIPQDARCILGYDGSAKHDLTALVCCYFKDENIWLKPYFFIPRSRALLKQKTDHVPYLWWESQGHITLTDGDCIDPHKVMDTIVKVYAQNNAECCVYDPWSFEIQRQQLEYEHGLKMVEMIPTPSRLSQACSHFEKECLAHTLHHPNHPVLTWNLENVRVKTISDKVYLEKKKCTQRIDGVSAALLALQYKIDNEKNQDIIYQTCPLIR